MVFQDHLNNVITKLEKYLLNLNIIEIGCGKAYFFNMLKNLNYKIKGCDPTYTGSDKSIFKNLFSKNLNLKGDFIILRHVLEHILDPYTFLKYIADTNNNQGLIYIEVPDLNWIIDNDVYFDFFYEHVNYFRPVDFTNIFNNIIEQGILFNGQYQYVIADLSSINKPPYNFIKHNFNITFNNLSILIDKLKNLNKNIYIWGAASKGVISSIHFLNNGININALIDINKNKQNKFSAISGIKIISPNDFKIIGNGSIVLIANPNYESEIKKELIDLKDIEYYIL